MIKSIYEEDVENKASASNESLVAEPEESLLETANKLDAVLGTDGSHNEILYGENGLVTTGEGNPIIPVKQGSAIAPPADDYNQYDPITGGALKVRSFFFVNTSIRSDVDANGNVWFIADDVCKALGYKNTTKAIADHCGKVYDSKDLDGSNELAKKMIVKDNKGSDHAMIAISEGDLYRLIAHSRKPEARVFEKWVYDIVLPALKKGKYTIKRKIEFRNPEDQAKFEAAKKELSGQCELFPRMVPSVSLPADITDRLNSVKKRLFEQGHTFPNNKEFVKFLVNKALEDLEG